MLAENVALSLLTPAVLVVAVAVAVAVAAILLQPAAKIASELVTPGHKDFTHLLPIGSYFQKGDKRFSAMKS